MLAPSYFEKLYNKSYFEAGRSPRNRSILGVCEDFEDKPDAKRALLDSFYFIALYGIVYSTDTPCCDVAEYHKGQNPYVLHYRYLHTAEDSYQRAGT